MLRRVLKATACILALPLLGIPSWIALNRGDLADPGDADLLEPVELDPGEDGYGAFHAAAEASVFPEDVASFERMSGCLERETWDGEWIEEQGRANREAFDHLERALAAAHMRLPANELGKDGWEDDGFFQDLASIQKLVRLSAALARLDVERGDPNAAFEHALLGMRVAKTLSQAAGVNMIAMMMAAAFQSISLHEVEHLLRETSPTRDEAAALANRLEAHRWDADSWRRTWAGEYRFTRTLLLDLAAQREMDPALEDPDQEEDFGTWLIRQLPMDFVLHPNRTRAELAERYREEGARSSSNCQEAYATRHRDALARDDLPEPAPWRVLGNLLVPNYFGRVMIEVAVPTSLRFDLKRCHVETRVSLVQSMAALEAYRIDEGDWPGTLADLVPRYLAAAPEDRFDGRPLRYAREARVVYSIGEDFSDDGPPEHPSQGAAAAPAISLAR